VEPCAATEFDARVTEPEIDNERIASRRNINPLAFFRLDLET